MCSAHRPALESVTVISNERLAEHVGRVVFEAPRTAAAIRPGQFVHLRIARGAAFILRRPFSVFRAGGGKLEVLYQVVGAATLALAEAEPGDGMDVIGPLGHGWEFPGGMAHALVVAGGLGIGPMGMLVEELARLGVASTLAQGAHSADRLLARDVFEDACRHVEVATDDGSAGRTGLVTDLMDDLVAADAPDVVYVCGPEPMQRIAAAKAAQAGIPCQVSLERLMACGVGVCLSCVVETTSGLLRACVDGPVFDASEVAWVGAGEAAVRQ
ncbi:MAG: dihydroorotate dehydrogenase electron transfer subunit [Coriobacteriia bacterium]